MPRLFAFGCSYTCYKWPTWADILSLNYDDYQNWARPGAGNHFIFYSLVEAINTQSISKEDTVVIMWTSTIREDTWRKGDWELTGPVHLPASKERLGNTFINNCVDPYGYDVKTLPLMDAAYRLLKSLGCEFHFLTGVQLPPLKVDYVDPDIPATSAIVETYKEVLSVTQDCVKNVIGYSLPKIKDQHPTPLQYFDYLDRLDLWNLTDSQREYAEYWDTKVLNQEDLSGHCIPYRTNRI